MNTATTYFILHPGGETATVITRRGNPRLIRRKERGWWCDCPTYRRLERDGRPGECQHTRLVRGARARLRVEAGQIARITPGDCL